MKPKRNRCPLCGKRKELHMFTLCMECVDQMGEANQLQEMEDSLWQECPTGYEKKDSYEKKDKKRHM